MCWRSENTPTLQLKCLPCCFQLQPAASPSVPHLPRSCSCSSTPAGMRDLTVSRAKAQSLEPDVLCSRLKCHLASLQPWASCSTSLCPRERLETGNACLPGSSGLLQRLCVCVSRSAVSDSLQPHGLQLTRLFCPWNSLGKNPQVGCHSLPNPGTSHIAGRFLTV